MKIQRIWAMPSKATFTIEPVRNLLREVMTGGKWIDPFAGFNSPATVTNDLNPKAPTDFHEDAEAFVRRFDLMSVDGVLFDPPYSPGQIKEMYEGIGLHFGLTEAQNGLLYARVRDALAPCVVLDGTVVSFGWNTQGMGKGRGFRLDRVLIIPHGGAHNDTLVTVERKIAGRAELAL